MYVERSRKLHLGHFSDCVDGIGVLSLSNRHNVNRQINKYNDVCIRVYNGFVMLHIGTLCDMSGIDCVRAFSSFPLHYFIFMLFYHCISCLYRLTWF